MKTQDTNYIDWRLSLEVMYVLDKSFFWENIDLETYEMENMIDEMLTKMESDDTFTIDEFVNREFSYVDDYDAKKIMSSLYEVQELYRDKDNN